MSNTRWHHADIRAMEGRVSESIAARFHFSRARDVGYGNSLARVIHADSCAQFAMHDSSQRDA
jgi:hypothetical protein